MTAPIDLEYIVMENGCHICTSHKPHKSGYPRITRSGRFTAVHVYVWEMVNGRLPDGMVIRHDCDNPLCCNLDHLLLGTHAENVQDRVLRNRSAKGTRNGRAKLTPEQVSEIRQCNESGPVLAKRFGINRSLVSKIRLMKVWA